MPGLTITEALAEIKTINKRLEKKRNAIGTNVGRDSQLKDPFEAQGGSVNYVASQRQSMRDLEKRIVDIRTSIQKVNLTTSLTLQGRTMTIAEWLTWRREVSPMSKSFLNQLAQGLQSVRTKVQAKGGKMVGPNESVTTDRGDVIAHLDEKALLNDIETTETILGELDGKLSLLNATTLLPIEPLPEEKQ